MEIVVTTKEIEYIPEWNKNREELAPMRATLRFLNTAQRADLIRFKADSNGRVTFEPDRARLLHAGLVKLEGLAVAEKDGKRAEIRTARDMLESFGLDALVVELVSKIVEMDPREGEVEKNS